MNTASSSRTQTPRIFSGIPHIVIALPGWSLRESLARALSFYRTSSVAVVQSDSVDDLEKGALGSDFRISFKSVALSTYPPGEKPGKGTSRHVVIAPSPVRERRHVQPVEKNGSCWLRFKLWFNTYRKFFTFIVLLNLVGLILTIMHVWQYPRKYTDALVLGNLLTAILVRNELFARLLYLSVNKLFAKWTPLWFRLGCTSVLQHLGGIHSGCAISGFAWLIFRLHMIFSHRKDNPGVVLFIGVMTSIALGTCIGSALPWIRNAHHNVFERHHRFLGWLGLISTWILIILADRYDTTTHSWNAVFSIAKRQDFWFCLCMTVFILTPWFTIRKVKVDVEVPSSKIAVVRFERGMQHGLLARISRSAVMEYHAFGIVSEGKHARYHYLICGVKGDFTRNLVLNPPTHLWTRQLKFAGISNTSTLYRRGIHICTGSGIGSALATCLQNLDWYLIWIGSEQAKTFGPTISGLIRRHIGRERITVWDCEYQGGRPDTMRLVKEVYTSWQAEVVFITSNRQGNQEIMTGCMEAGIPAFGTLWDF
ncbi:hypothetical protein F5148DRAFT_1283931 [Russula earlei]|uniref:Uncharacterized protein n=1 Tax=Russula earlei TaxID=71964 RepID=A0ACC0UAB4_9AGAM|nr:hypothetical protein F5148DRAFT_1283931 [Russula earlei]